MEQSMNERIARIFKRNDCKVQDVQYVTHTNQRTYLKLLDGREILTTVPLKTIGEFLPSQDFCSIQKGVLVGIRHVISIDDQGLYTMKDGRQFQGRGRNPAEHRRRRRALNLPAEPEAEGPGLPHFLEQCRLLEFAPIAFCVIELVFAENGHSIDFVFRYCNREMENLEGMKISEMLNRSFYEVFPAGDRKWIVPYADVAINGSNRIIREYSPELNKNLIIRCFQPMTGYCACLTTEAEEETWP